VTAKQNSSLGIVFILGLLAMLMPLSIDMYLPALPVIAAQFNVPDGSAQMTLSTYILGFALGQLLYGPMADSIGRKPVILAVRWFCRGGGGLRAVADYRYADYHALFPRSGGRGGERGD
jgi:MFS family permease